MNTQQIRRDHLTAAFEDARPTGYVVECGVGAGLSLRLIAGMARPKQRVFGFDSFEGLPEEWTISEDVTFPVGSFQHEPPNIKRVEYRIGLFADTIPQWSIEHPGRITFLHIDSDLYSSCVTILEKLNDQITPRTVIVFDEIYGFPHYQYWKDGEYKAFNEWQTKYDRKVYKLSENGVGGAAFRVTQ